MVRVEAERADVVSIVRCFVAEMFLKSKELKGSRDFVFLCGLVAQTHDLGESGPRNTSSTSCKQCRKTMKLVRGVKLVQVICKPVLLCMSRLCFSLHLLLEVFTLHFLPTKKQM